MCHAAVWGRFNETAKQVLMIINGSRKSGTRTYLADIVSYLAIPQDSQQLISALSAATVLPGDVMEKLLVHYSEELMKKMRK